MKMKNQLPLLALLLCILGHGLTWAASPATLAAPTGDESAAEAVPFDPFDPFDDSTNDPFAGDDDAVQSVADPIVGFNRAMFAFNDKLYFWVLKPVAIGYRTVFPTPVRLGVKNFFYNLLTPVRFVNCLLQGKDEAAKGEFIRFMVNTTYGVGGLFNPAKNYPGLTPPAEDFGQTLGLYHAGNGFYIVWPLFGPSTLRDTVGSVGDWALNPLTFIKLIQVDAGELTTTTTGAAVFGLRTVNDTSFHIGDYEALKNAALDPYEAFRNAYIQNRNSKIAQ
ncbi:hypothetical protein DSCO28_40590 [Desulfosarcina ovata subsp. sediminis]|uniref:VacJ family lipoprotein n=1 Tax=Desulfosarcina ovata subsp. sediminis TaxID=885957 RepID=A0A5K7ZTE7_9BACT|nr:VacJ family lipoprotein [Desulfosarcina ovata]BBO83493.1 hypothetical protein DSCO28_40590 [Desulfosarcina ovata subsp. sediminis]